MASIRNSFLRFAAAAAVMTAAANSAGAQTAQPAPGSAVTTSFAAANNNTPGNVPKDSSSAGTDSRAIDDAVKYIEGFMNAQNSPASGNDAATPAANNARNDSTSAPASTGAAAAETPARPRVYPATRVIPGCIDPSAVVFNFDPKTATPEQREAFKRATAELDADRLPFAKPLTLSSGWLVSRNASTGFSHIRMDYRPEMTAENVRLLVVDEIDRYPGAVVIANFKYEGTQRVFDAEAGAKQHEILLRLAGKLAETSQAEIVYLEIVSMQDAPKGSPERLESVFGIDHGWAMAHDRLGPDGQQMGIKDSSRYLVFPYANVYFTTDKNRSVISDPAAFIQRSFDYSMIARVHAQIAKEQGRTDEQARVAGHNEAVRSMYRSLTSIVESANTRLAQEKTKDEKPKAIAKANEPSGP